MKNQIFRTNTSAFCIKCEKPIELLSFSQVADTLKTNCQEVYRLAEIGDLHRIHNEKGIVMICSESLLDVFDTRQTVKLSPDIFKTNPSGNFNIN